MGSKRGTAWRLTVVLSIFVAQFSGWNSPLMGGTEAEPAPLSRVSVATADALETALRLEALGFDVLPATSVDRVEVVVTPRELAALRRRGYVVAVIERGRPMREIIRDRAAVRGGGVPAGYLDLDTIYAALAQAEADHPAICRVVDLTAQYGAPPTFEDRNLFALRISDNVGLDEDEPSVLIVSAHHCRELVTPVIALNAIAELTNGYGTDPDITAAIDGNEIWIAPIWNPDGYVHVFDVDNLWRKNRRTFRSGTGVDLNRNYPFGWTSDCSGSEDPSSSTYKGPDPASESETQTMMQWSLDRHFAKVLDYHSAGREALWGYACLDHPFTTYLQAEAVALSDASGFEGDERGPSADGEHYQWQLGGRGAHAFLVETHDTFQPPFESAEDEAALVFPGVLHMLEREIPLSGHVTDAVSGLPVIAEICVTDVKFGNGEANASGGPFGRYHVFAPADTYDIAYSAEGYLGQTHAVTVVAKTATTREVRLTPLEYVGDANRDGVVGFRDVLDLLASWGPCPPLPDPCPGDFDGNGMIDFGDILLVLANWD